MESEIKFIKGFSNNDLEVSNHSKLCIYENVHDLSIHFNNKEICDDTIFSATLTYGQDEVGEDKDMFFSMDINELEMFAESLLTQIKIVRRDFKKEIEYQKSIGGRI